MQSLDDERPTANKLFNNFMMMSVLFSINHATVTACIALATTDLHSAQLGNLQLALLYAFYTLTALLFANLIVSKTGYKWGMVYALLVYVAYVGSFIIAAKVPSLKWPAATIGGSLGGIGAGFLWSAQGPYFAKNAEMYAEATGEDGDAVRARFAAYFAIPYLGCEVLFKLLQTIVGSTDAAGSLGWSEGSDFILIINTVCAIAAAIGCMFIMEMKNDQPEVPFSSDIIFQKAAAAIHLLFSDPKMVCMMGMNISFGISAAYMNGFVIGTVAPLYIGNGYAGYLASITAATAALVSVPTVLKLVKPEWKKFYMVGGPLCFGLVGLLPLAFGFDKLGNWGGIVTLFVLQGLGRGVWEATNKDLFAEYFHYDTLGAFSNIIIQNGATSAIVFFVNAYGNAIPKCPTPVPTPNTTHHNATQPQVGEGDCEIGVYSSEAWACVIFAVLSIVGFFIASGFKAKGVDSWSQVCGDHKDARLLKEDSMDEEANPSSKGSRA